MQKNLGNETVRSEKAPRDEAVGKKRWSKPFVRRSSVAGTTQATYIMSPFPTDMAVYS